MTVLCRSLLLYFLIASPVAAWDLVPDPPAAVPDWAPANGLAVVCGSLAQDIRFADQGGPFVAVDAARDRTRLRRVYDLRNGKAVGDVPKPNFQVRCALDPTGAALAAVEIQKRKEVILYDVSGGRESARVGLAWEPTSLRFLSADRLLAHGHFPTPQHWAVIDVKAGAVVKEWDHPGPTGEGPSVSSGGRYFAFGTTSVTVFDLRDGKLVATLPVDMFWQVRGTAFAANGTALAAVLYKGKEHRLMVWSLADGKAESAPLPFARGTPGALAVPLQPVRSGGWLVEQEHVVDADGKLVRSLPVDPGQQPARLALRPDLVIGSRKVEGWSDQVLSVIDDRPPPIPDRPVGFGGLKAPVAYPPATEPDLSVARTVAGTPAGWGGPLDSAPAPRPRFPTTVPTEGRLPIGLHVSRDGGWACVAFQNGRLAFVNTDTGAATGAEVPAAFHVAGDSVDGAAWPTTDGSRVDLYDRAGRHVAGWKPAAPAKVVYAAALRTDRVVTVVEGGRVTMWALPACQAVWMSDARSATAATLSPGGKYLLVAGGEAVTVIDLEIGGTHGVLAAPNLIVPGVPTAPVLAVRPDGKELAVLSPEPGGLRQLGLWNLEAGKSARSFPAPTVAGSLAYAGPDHLAADRSVFDLRRQAEVWEFNFLGPPLHARRAPADGRIWYAVPAGRPGDLAIVPGEFPAADVSVVTASVADAPNRVLGPGERVHVDVRFDGAPGGLAADARTAAEKTLRARGFAPDPAGPVTLRLIATRRPTGRTIQITDIGPRAPGIRRPLTENLTEYDVAFRLELARAGELLWTGREDKFSMGIERLALSITIPDDRMTATEHFARKVWGEAARAAGSPFNFPVTFAAATSGGMRTLPGQTMMSPDGLSTRWPAGYAPQQKDQVDRAPAERRVYQSTAGADPPPAGNAGGILRWVLIAVGGAMVLMFLGGVLLIVILKRKAPRGLTPPPLPGRRRR